MLIVGAGPSGLDLTVELSKVARKVTLSHHTETPITAKFNSRVDQKPDIVRLTRSGAIFRDGTKADYTVVIYCTGYKFDYPFLSIRCNITCEKNYIRPLYKHCININHPTMAFIGLPYYEVPAQMCDLQVRFFLTFLTGRKPMPSKKEMMKEMDQDMQKQWARGLKVHRAHFIFGQQNAYYAELAKIAGIDPIKPVVVKLQTQVVESFNTDFINFRQNRYRIVDDENFIKL